MNNDQSHSTDCQRNAAANAFLALSGVTLTIIAVIIPLRVYVRVKMVKNFGLDDVCILVAAALVIPTFVFLFEAIHLGIGKRQHCVKSLSDGVLLVKYQYIAEVLEIYCVIFSRLSAALFVIRLFAITSRLKNFLYGYAMFMTVSLAVTGILVLVQCSPTAALWDTSIKGHCWSPTATSFINNFNGAVSILSDFLLAATPIYFLWTVQMRTKLKIAVCSLMGVSVIPGICATARTALAYTQTSSDPVYSFAILIVFGGLETTMAIICATIPALAPLFSEQNRQRFTKPTRYQEYYPPSNSGITAKHTMKSNARNTGLDTIDTTPLVPLGKGHMGIKKTVELSVT